MEYSFENSLITYIIIDYVNDVKNKQEIFIQKLYVNDQWTINIELKSNYMIVLNNIFFIVIRD